MARPCWFANLLKKGGRAVFSFACIVLSKLIHSINKDILCFILCITVKEVWSSGWSSRKSIRNSPAWFLICVTSPWVRCFMTDSYFDSAAFYGSFIRFWNHQKSSSETFLWRTEWEEDWMGGGQENDSPLTWWKKWKISPIKKRSESVSSQGCNAVCLWLCHALCSEP